jgi:Uma2 family endonuclease
MPVIAIKTISERDFIRLIAGDNWIEVVNWEVVPTMSAANISHAYIITNVYDMLRPFAKEHALGYVFGDGLHYRLEATAQGLKNTRLPDVSFVRKHRLTSDIDPNGLFPGAPDLAVEVVSPDESLDTTLVKVADYLHYGSEQVWVLYPNSKEVQVYQADDPQSIRIYQADDVLTAENLFPGLAIIVSQFFKLPFGE